MFAKTNTFVKHTGNYIMPTNTEERPRVYLNKVHLKGFKSIEDVTIDFQKGLNILIGKNGAGKSNLLEIIDQIIGKEGSNVGFKYAELQFVSNDKQKFEIEIEKKLSRRNFETEYLGDGEALVERFLLNDIMLFDTSFDSDTFTFNERQIKYRGNLRHLFGSLHYGGVYPLLINYHVPDSLDYITRTGTFKINYGGPFPIGEWPKKDNFISVILHKLENVSDFYGVNDFREITPSQIKERLKIQDEIVENLKLYTEIKDVRFSDNFYLYSNDEHLIIDNIKLEFCFNNTWLPWSQLSDGTRRLFYIITEITHTSGLVLLDEPELGVHPHQFHLLMNFLKEQSEYKQIIISTHAPKALDHLNLDELNNILLVNYDRKNGTQLRHLTDEEQTKAQEYAKEVGYVSDYWMYSDLEE
jgi:ABC-type multidrug transport system ATPase subunit